MENQEIRTLIESQDELISVCRACFDVIFKARLKHKLDAALVSYNVEPGFVDRAEQVREKVSPEYRRILAASGLTLASTRNVSN
jgi:hypothetical protein